MCDWVKKRRKLFCEHGPVCYAISLWKENCKRTLRDWLGRSHFAKNFEEKTLPYVWKGHMSMMLRPLAGVDMQLQRNKVQNLRLAAKQIDGVVVAPGETFSLWALVGIYLMTSVVRLLFKMYLLAIYMVLVGEISIVVFWSFKKLTSLSFCC